jgi:hypothetical protein
MTNDMSIGRLGLWKNACGKQQVQANSKAKSFHGSSAPSRAGAQRLASAQSNSIQITLAADLAGLLAWQNRTRRIHSLNSP